MKGLFFEFCVLYFFLLSSGNIYMLLFHHFVVFHTQVLDGNLNLCVMIGKLSIIGFVKKIVGLFWRVKRPFAYERTPPPSHPNGRRLLQTANNHCRRNGVKSGFQQYFLLRTPGLNVQ